MVVKKLDYARCFPLLYYLGKYVCGCLSWKLSRNVVFDLREQKHPVFFLAGVPNPVGSF